MIKRLKQFTALLISCILIAFTTFNTQTGTVGAVRAETPKNNPVWCGGAAEGYAGGDGTENAPYLITTAEQLAYFAETYQNNPTAYYEMTVDIYLNRIDGEAFEKKNVWVNNQNWFSGNFNGNGHIIYGLYVPESAAAEYAGFIPKIDRGCVRNLGISHADMTAASDCGAVIGYVRVHNDWTWDENEVVLAEQCFSNETVNIKGICAGGIIGRADNGGDWECKRGRGFFVRNCYSSADISGNTASAIIGYIFANRVGVQNCYTVTDKNILQHQWLNEGNEGYTYYHSKNYAVSAQDGISNTITVGSIIGYAAKENMPGFDFETVWGTKEGAYPFLTVFERRYDVWSGKTADSYESGSGTESDPYLIKTAEQLAFFASSYNSENSAGKYYRLISNIYMNQLTDDGFEHKNIWINSQKEFHGSFDGGGHTVYGLYVPDTSNAGCAGFIPVTFDAEVKNLGIMYSAFNAKEAAGAIVGNIAYCYKSTSIDCCFADETVSVVAKYAGGILGIIGWNANNTAVRNSYFTGMLSGDIYEGGIVGFIGSQYSRHAVSDCYCAAYNSKRAVGAVQNGALISNVYSDCKNDENGVVSVAGWRMTGKYAKTVLQFDLSFSALWQSLENHTPVLKMFATNGCETAGRYFYIYDVNGDGQTDICDLIRLKKDQANLSAGLNGDVNGDGKRNALDFTILRKVLLGMFNNSPAPEDSAVPEIKDGRVLVWHDEFDGENLNRNKWGFERLMTTPGAIYQNDKDHVYIDDGKLTMKVLRTEDNNYSLCESITTLNTMCFKYGYLEMRAKVPFMHGAWPSLWMKTKDPFIDKTGDWFYAEIDIFEVFSSMNKLEYNLHKWSRFDDGRHAMLPGGEGNMVRNFTFGADQNPNDYHIYGFEWNEHTMSFYVDDIKYDEIIIDETNNFNSHIIDGMGGFHDYAFLIINNEIFTENHSWYPEGAPITPEDPTPTYTIDWIRLYQDKNNIKIHLKDEIQKYE